MNAGHFGGAGSARCAGLMSWAEGRGRWAGGLGAEEAGAVGLEELAEVVDAGHDALAFVGVAD